jgi:hypothetical protein
MSTLTFRHMKTRAFFNWQKAQVIAVLVWILPLWVMAQPEATMYTLKGVIQSNNYNPAFIPQHKVVVGLGIPSLHAHYSNSSFSYNDLIVKSGDSSIVDLDKFRDKLNKKNYITAAGDIEFFRLGIKINPRLYVHWSASARMFTRQMLPKDLTTLLIDGTAGFVNNSASIAPEVEATSYLESAWGASYMATNKLTVGARIKLLNGIINASTENSDLNLSLNDDYQMTVRADVNTRTSGIENIDDVDFGNDYKNFLKNKGFAIDLGATYKLTNELTVGGSLLDVGFINWKNDTYAYTLDPSTASYTFKGVNLQKIIDGEEDYLDAEMDSIETKFEMQEGAIGSYRTPLPGKMYFTANYDLKKQISLGAVLFFEKFQGRFYPGFSASIHKEFWRIAGVSISYTATNRAFGNFGAGFNLNLTPFQFYIAGDNLLRMPISYLANGDYSEFAGNVRYFNLRAGVNLIFARDRSKDKKAYNQRKK